jgi:dTDP-4-dehydrorhamnose reductase|tara:strand:- start:4580 stop:5434 length:855 start_codon:yes stop_codon:yes gene_type:complete
MKILILGVSGLIGHNILKEFDENFEVFGTLHKSKKKYGNLNLFSSQNIIENVDVKDFEILKSILFAINPDVILNCVGITKRKIDKTNPIEVIMVNSVFPHQLAEWAKSQHKRVIHFSTDCVFDGKVGNYSETSLTTAEDLYGRTKALGEINYPYSLTIRSSFIGQELFENTELLDWFLSQDGKQIKGFTNTFYSGVSTLYLARVVKDIIQNYPKLNGLYQLAPERPISKYDLLSIANKAFQVNVDIIPDDTQKHFPTLDASKLRQTINLKVPSWEDMMAELAIY